MAKKKTATVVPIDEQVTEAGETPAEVLETVAAEKADALATVIEANATPLEIDPTLPWAAWPAPDTFPAKLKDLSVRNEAGRLILVGEQGDAIAPVNANGMQQLGWNAVFPVEFVNRFNDAPDLQAQIINHRIQNGDRAEKQYTVVVENGEFANFFPGWRGVAPFQQVAQTAFNALRDVYGTGVELDDCRQGNGKMALRLLTNLQEPVTRKTGDVLQMGIQIDQDYGQQINLALYVRRLVCLNGMTAEAQEFKWKTRSEGSVEHQLAWVTTGIGAVVGAFNGIVERARLMADTPVNGDARNILQEHARAMRFPSRYFGRLVDAFEQEPEMTQWGILNAFTRVATHSLSGETQRTFQASAGGWTQEFDLVNARLPRPVAVRLGAEIVEAA